MNENDEVFTMGKNESPLHVMQMDQSATIICNKEYKDQTAVSMIRECLKIAKDDNELYQKLIADIGTMQMNLTSMTLIKKPKETSGLVFGHSGKSKKTRDKRKGNY